ncbi:MAG: MFS transporter [Mycobacterium leprae]
MASYIREHYQLWLTFPRSVKLFYVTDIFFAVATAIFSTLFNLHLLAMGFTAEHIGRLSGVMALLVAVLAIPIGLAGDRWGSRRLYAAGSICWATPFLVLPWLHSFPLILAAQAVTTVGAACMNVNEAPLLAGEVPTPKRAFMFSFMMINFFLWTTLGTQLSGFLSSWLPAGGLSVYQWPLFVSALCGLTAAVGRCLLPFRRQVPTSTRFNLRPSRTTLLMALLSVLVGAYSALTQYFGNVVLAQHFHFDAARIATILSVGGVLSWLGSMAVPWTSRRFGDLRGYMIAVGLQAAALTALGLAGSAWLFLPFFWARNMLFNMQGPLFSSFSMSVTPETERATTSSYNWVGRSLGAAVAAKGFGSALTVGHYATSFITAGGIALVAALLVQFGFRARGHNL